MAVLYVGPGPSEEAPGLIITDEPCPDCGWEETHVRMFAEDNSIAKDCPSCERREWIDPVPRSIERESRT